MEHLRLTQEAASSSPAVPAMPKSPENALEFSQDAAVARRSHRTARGNHMLRTHRETGFHSKR